MARKGDPDRISDPDVEVGASVKAKKMRFRKAPKTDVRLHGEIREGDSRSELETTSGSERENLPEEVEPGVDYEDVRVRWRAAARLEDPASPDQELGNRDNPTERGVSDEEQGKRQERRRAR